MFICQKHGKYSSAKGSNGCPHCKSDKPNITEILRTEFVVKATKLHRRKYNYDEFVFVDFLTPGVIKCRRHGRFLQSPAVHILHRAKCPKCSGSISVGETEWLDYLGVKERNEILFIGNKSIRPDGIDRQGRIVYEYLGAFWHGDPSIYPASGFNKKAKRTFGKLYEDTLKREALIRSAGFKIVKIWDHEWEAFKKSQKPVKKKRAKK